MRRCLGSESAKQVSWFAGFRLFIHVVYVTEFLVKLQTVNLQRKTPPFGVPLAWRLEQPVPRHGIASDPTLDPEQYSRIHIVEGKLA